MNDDRAKVNPVAAQAHVDNASQRQRFEDAARAAECDEDEARWEAKLREIAKQKPKPE
jgi:hypothetical protein